MKDRIIKGTFIRRELIIFFASFIVSVILNAYSIIHFNTEWIEMISQLHVVILLSAILYFITGGIRFVYGIIASVFKKKQ